MNTKEIAVEYRLAHWAQIIHERVESGQSIKAFCMNAGIHENTYFYWQKKLREATCEHLEMKPADPKPTDLVHTGFAEVKLQDNLPRITHSEPVSQGNLSIVFSGVKIIADSTYPSDKLAYLLRELVKQC
jgi:hypothetical protein